MLVESYLTYVDPPPHVRTFCKSCTQASTELIRGDSVAAPWEAICASTVTGVEIPVRTQVDQPEHSFRSQSDRVASGEFHSRKVHLQSLK